MTVALPEIVVPRVDDRWASAQDPANWRWDAAATLSPLILADGSGPAMQQTETRICYSSHAFYVRFDCQDQDIWGTYTKRDDPIYDEEVVELYIAHGEATPVDYYEFEVSPNGVLLDLSVHNTSGYRSDMIANFGWNCPGLLWAATRDDANQGWWATFAVPWASIGAAGALPPIWRANFYRIERPRNGDAEFSCWSPTLTDPPDYHKPARFGRLILG